MDNRSLGNFDPQQLPELPDSDNEWYDENNAPPVGESPSTKKTKKEKDPIIDSLSESFGLLKKFYGEEIYKQSKKAKKEYKETKKAYKEYKSSLKKHASQPDGSESVKENGIESESLDKVKAETTPAESATRTRSVAFSGRRDFLIKHIDAKIAKLAREIEPENHRLLFKINHGTVTIKNGNIPKITDYKTKYYLKQILKLQDEIEKINNMDRTEVKHEVDKLLNKKKAESQKLMVTGIACTSVIAAITLPLLPVFGVCALGKAACNLSHDSSYYEMQKLKNASTDL